MTLYVVTIKLDKEKGHNGRKLTGACRYDEHTVCDDCAGEHHSFVHIESDNGRGIADGTIRKMYEEKGFHVTRVEMG